MAAVTAKRPTSESMCLRMIPVLVLNVREKRKIKKVAKVRKGKVRMPESREDRKQGCNNPAGSPSLPIPNYLLCLIIILKPSSGIFWKGRVFTVINMTRIERRPHLLHVNPPVQPG